MPFQSVRHRHRAVPKNTALMLPNPWERRKRGSGRPDRSRPATCRRRCKNATSHRPANGQASLPTLRRLRPRSLHFGTKGGALSLRVTVRRSCVISSRSPGIVGGRMFTLLAARPFAGQHGWRPTAKGSTCEDIGRTSAICRSWIASSLAMTATASRRRPFRQSPGSPAEISPKLTSARLDPELRRPWAETSEPRKVSCG